MTRKRILAGAIAASAAEEGEIAMNRFLIAMVMLSLATPAIAKPRAPAPSFYRENQSNRVETPSRFERALGLTWAGASAPTPIPWSGAERLGEAFAAWERGRDEIRRAGQARYDAARERLLSSRSVIRE